MEKSSWQIGMMHPAYRVGKNALLDWINSSFGVNYSKVEECATGAIYCQILDAIYPGSIKLQNVNWGQKDRLSPEKLMFNWKIVQKIFSKKHITKPVDVQKLVNGKFQDNLEFLQWFAHFFNCMYSDNPYHAENRRNGKRTPKSCTIVLDKLNTDKNTKAAGKKVKPVIMPELKVQTSKKKKKKKKKNESEPKIVRKSKS